MAEHFNRGDCVWARESPDGYWDEARVIQVEYDRRDRPCGVRVYFNRGRGLGVVVERGCCIRRDPKLHGKDKPSG